MQVVTYTTRDFATLGPLELQPLFIGDYILSFKKLIYFTLQHWAGLRYYTSFYNFAESCVFDKQSLFIIMCHQTLLNKIGYLLSKSYKINLPSSFNIIISFTLIFSISLPVSVYGTVYVLIINSEEKHKKFK